MNTKALLDISRNFERELTLAALGKKTSLPFIKHVIPSYRSLRDKEKGQVLVIGGRVYKKALFENNHDGIRLLGKVRGNQPIFTTKKDLLDFVSNSIDRKVKKLAINFAYPMRPVTTTYSIDGILLSGSKENTFTGLIQKPIGKTLETFLLTSRKKTTTIAVANDSICLLLSGLSKRPWGEIAGGIVGAGLNFALFLNKNTVVNLEAANFNKFTQTPEGSIIDKQSASPGTALIEKEISGAYLYRHFNEIIQRIDINIPLLKETKQLSYTAKHGVPKTAKIASRLLQRSAQLVGALVAGTLLFQKRDLHFIMEGSLFWKGYRYKETVEKTLRKLVPQFSAHFVRIPDSDIIGGAKLIA